MKTLGNVLSLLIMLAMFFSSTAVMAGDFDWTRDLDIRAEADPSGFRAQLSTRFKIGDAQVKIVLDNVDRPADAYLVFRLGEMSSKPIEHVLQNYKVEKGKGWGNLAKSLGIKPGSKEFQSLKQGGSIDRETDKSKKGKHGKGKG